MSHLLSAAKTALWFAATALCLVSSLFVWKLGNHLDRTLSSVDATIGEVNRPCGAKDAQGKLLAPGTLCSIGKMVTQFGDLTVTAQKQVAQTDQLVNAASQALDTTASSLQSTASTADRQLEHIGPAIDSITKSSDAIPPAIQSVTAALLDKNTGLPPILSNADRGFIDLDALISSPDIQAAVKNVNTTSGNFASMSADAQIRFHDLLFPPPCRGFKCRIGEGLNDVRLGSQFIEPMFYLKQLLSGDAVDVSGTVHVQQQRTAPQ